MAALRIDPADDTPLVVLDKGNKQFELSGKSMPEDVIEFYQPVLNWLNEYKTDPADLTSFNFKLIYFNTASSKLILDVLLILEEIKDAGHKVVVRWHSPENDEDMQEAGQEYAEMVELDFEHLTYNL